LKEAGQVPALAGFLKDAGQAPIIRSVLNEMIRTYCFACRGSGAVSAAQNKNY